MESNKTNKVLEVYGNPTFKTPNGSLSLARQSKDDVVQISNLSDIELVAEWKRLSYLNNILGYVSLNDLQRIDLLELEIDGRESVDNEALKTWFTETECKFNEEQYPEN